MTCKNFIDFLAKRYSVDGNNTISYKENDIMKFNDVKIMVGNRLYPATSVDYIQTSDTYPIIRAESTINPFNYYAVSNRYNTTSKPLTIENVIFNPPATIVFWSDKTKTVVKCDYSYEQYDPEKGIAMAIAKKTMGENKGAYYEMFKRWSKKWKEQQEETVNG